jgi:hypothetical protein
MQEAHRHLTELIRDIFLYSLIGLLVFNIFSAFVILFINAEAFFLGQKIAGTSANVYAIGLLIVTALVMICLYKKTKGYTILALAYGIWYFINGYLAVLYFGRQVPSIIHWLVFVLSVIIFGSTLLIISGKPAVPEERNIPSIFAQHPRAGLLLSVGALICFLLMSSLSQVNYQNETNTYTYFIDIDSESPLHNVTLMLPLPSRISRNVTAGELYGSSLPEFTNYSQSVIKTKNGTMIQILADSIEPPEDEQPLDPVRQPLNTIQLYYVANVHGHIISAYPLNHEPILEPKYELEPSSCTGKTFERIALWELPQACSVYGSTAYASFETEPASRTTITVSFDGSRVITPSGASGPAKREGYEDSISLSFSGNAGGWYNATGTLLAG